MHEEISLISFDVKAVLTEVFWNSWKKLNSHSDNIAFYADY